MFKSSENFYFFIEIYDVYISGFLPRYLPSADEFSIISLIHGSSHSIGAPVFFETFSVNHHGSRSLSSMVSGSRAIGTFQ